MRSICSVGDRSFSSHETIPQMPRSRGGDVIGQYVDASGVNSTRRFVGALSCVAFSIMNTCSHK
jgi:hypothetical protein